LSRAVAAVLQTCRECKDQASATTDGPPSIPRIPAATVTLRPHAGTLARGGTAPSHRRARVRGGLATVGAGHADPVAPSDLSMRVRDLSPSRVSHARRRARGP
jgi:hypothetical protein